MRVLFISLSLPPFAESQTIRSAYLIHALAQRGVAFDLITAHTAPLDDRPLAGGVAARVVSGLAHRGARL
jgi:hypothetical protein